MVSVSQVFAIDLTGQVCADQLDGDAGLPALPDAIPASGTELRTVDSAEGDGDWRVLEPGTKVVGRVITAQYMPVPAPAAMMGEPFLSWARRRSTTSLRV